MMLTSRESRTHQRTTSTSTLKTSMPLETTHYSVEKPSEESTKPMSLPSSSLFLLTALSSAVSAYLNYKLDPTLARDVLFMFFFAAIMDLLFFRNLIIAIIALFKYCRAKKQGYEYVPFKKRDEVNTLINHAIQQMYHHHREK